MSQKIRDFECKCEGAKTHRLTYDGGSSGQYVVEFCRQCYEKEDKNFMISEKELGMKQNNFKEIKN